MFDLQQLVALFMASAVVMIAPGPSIALTVAHSVRAGFPTAIFSILGTLTGTVGQLGLALAMVEFIARWQSLLQMVKWAGVAYLVWLGLSMIRYGIGSQRPAPATSGGNLFREAFVVAAVNPKSLLFYMAFLPQFPLFQTGAEQALAGVITILISSVLSVMTYAWLGDRARRIFQCDHHTRRSFSIALGNAYLTVAIWLAL